MTSPIPPRVSERETAMNRLAVPSARIFAATIILITGAGISAVFWKMPKANEFHALYHEGVVNPDLAAVPLPNESIAAISPEEMQQITLPVLDIAPIAADGARKYAQVYPAPALLTMINTEHDRDVLEEETPFTPFTPQKFEPIRQIIEEKPISVEPVSRDFPPMPTSMSTTERSDELFATFHFVENNRAELADLPEQPTDPFSRTVASALATLQPLQPLQFDGHSPLLPLREINLQPLPELVMQ